ncbi:TPM domain-containing protein [Streptomyces sp. NPDC091292]|uniref:TPM domain-containing protein n=1 Tax=Streptomyces sp. NPDC091292 TaxID=3365991 RepID=UPI0038096B31
MTSSPSRAPSHIARPVAALAPLAVLAALLWLLLPPTVAQAAQPTPAVTSAVRPLPAAAPAVQPIPLSRTGQITDTVGALGDREGAVTTALDTLDRDHGEQLFVAYVRDFSGQSPQSWADATANRNGLGLNDVLLAVATHARQYAYSVDPNSRLTDAQLHTVATTAIEPALRQNDWAGAAIGAANGMNATFAGLPVTTPTITPGPADPNGSGVGSGDQTGPGDLILPIVAVGGAGALAAYAYSRRKRHDGGGTRTGGAHGGWGSGGEGPGGQPPPTPLPALDKEARQRLVETDDAVRTSTEEVGFAAAQFGDEAVRPFQEALAYAQSELTAAFRLRQQLDDAYPEDDPTKRRMLDEIIARCADANSRLDAETADFDRLRALERTAPEALERARQAYAQVDGRTGAAQEALTRLAHTYAPTAALPVAGHVQQARDRLVFASAGLDQARDAIAAGDNGKAAVFLRASEGAVDQAGTFVDAIERLAGELAAADAKLPGALTETETDLADARGMLDGTVPGVSTADLRGRIARADAVMAEVHREMAAGPYDPIDALRRLEAADAALDESLAGARAREVADSRARSLLDQAMLTARSGVSAATDFVTTHRGAVGSEARTRLTEAQRHLARAEQLAASGPTSGGDPSGALAEAQQADAMARQARQYAERDVRSYGNPYGGSVGGGVGGIGGRAGGGMGGAVLGGIILGEILGGMGGRGRGRGGFGGGGFGGGFGGGPGSFGGGGTRGRRGGGGRF